MSACASAGPTLFVKTWLSIPESWSDVESRLCAPRVRGIGPPDTGFPLQVRTFSVAFWLVTGLPAAAFAHRPLDLDLEWGRSPVVGDLTGTALGGRAGDRRFGAFRGLQLDGVDAGLRLARGLRLVGRVEVGVNETFGSTARGTGSPRETSKDVVMGACELGLRVQPWRTRVVRTFVSAGAGWVGGGFIGIDTAAGAIAIGDHVFDPQVHVQAGMDLKLSGGWSFELRLPFRYLWGPDLPLGAATVGFRHSM
jgi:hypothetical protein